MKTKLFIAALISFFISFSSPVCGQKENYIWYFGFGAGIDFNSGSAVGLSNGMLQTFEGCSSICDANGNLLFYTDGVTVYDHNHVMMPNGNALAGGTSATQSALIVQDPGNSMLYYIFTVENESPTSDFSYSIVDMTLNSNNGDVTVKNVVLLIPVAEKLTAVKHANGNDVWVMVHENGNNSYSAWLLTAGGVSSSPVISNIGPVISISEDLRGQIKFSPDGTKLASAENGNNYVDLFDFDPATGIVSDEKYLNMPAASIGQGAYGLEFSASSHYLYSGIASPSQIYQWDISSDSATIINASQ